MASSNLLNFFRSTFCVLEDIVRPECQHKEFAQIPSIFVLRAHQFDMSLPQLHAITPRVPLVPVCQKKKPSTARVMFSIYLPLLCAFTNLAPGNLLEILCSSFHLFIWAKVTSHLTCVAWNRTIQQFCCLGFTPCGVVQRFAVAALTAVPGMTRSYGNCVRLPRLR